MKTASTTPNNPGPPNAPVTGPRADPSCGVPHAPPPSPPSGNPTAPTGPAAPSAISKPPIFRSILFVDDDDLVLAGLRRMLRPFRTDWQMAFAASGREALEILAHQPCDVLVTDMQMQGMDGADLLHEVRRRHPNVVRFVLSGQVNPEPLLQCIENTHQFLAKPCNADVLRTALIHATSFCPLPPEESLRLLVNQTGHLPSPPKVLIELDQALQSGDQGTDQLGAIIGHDIGMSGQLLKLANSAFFGLSHPVMTPADAIAYLGIDLVRALAVATYLEQQAEAGGVAAEEVGEISRHCLAVSALAAKIARRETGSEELASHSAAAGLLHDAGKLILATQLPQRWAEVTAQTTQNPGLSRLDAERQVFGCTHQEVGAYLFCLWGLPLPIVEAVGQHHQPVAAPGSGFTLLTAVHAANAVVLEGEGRAATSDPWHRPYLEQLHLVDCVPQWRLLRAGRPNPDSIPA